MLTIAEFVEQLQKAGEPQAAVEFRDMCDDDNVDTSLELQRIDAVSPATRVTVVFCGPTEKLAQELKEAEDSASEWEEKFNDLSTQMENLKVEAERDELTAEEIIKRLP